MKIENKHTPVEINGISYHIFKHDAFTQLQWEAKIVKMLVGKDGVTITDLIEKYKSGDFKAISQADENSDNDGLAMGIMTDIFNGLMQNDTEEVAKFIKLVCETSVKTDNGDDLVFNTAFDERVHDAYLVFFEVLKFNYSSYFLG